MTTFERTLLHLSSFAAAVTGFAYLWMKYLIKGTDPFSVVHHPWQPGVLALHVLVVPLLVFALGWIAKDHVVKKLLDRRSRASRLSGVVIMVVAVPMIVSGYVVQVLTGPSPRKVVAWSHIVAGAAFSVGYVVHLLQGGSDRASPARKGRARSRRPTRAAVQPRLDRPGGLGLESISGPRPGAAVECAQESPEGGRP